MGQDKCMLCGLTEDTTFDWIQCNNCKLWCHGGCVASSKEEYSSLAANQLWFCKICITSSNIKNELKVAINLVLEESRKNSKLEDNLIVDSILEKMWPSLNAFIELKVKTAVEEKSQIINNLSHRISLLENHQCKLERDWRKRNLVIQGIPNDIKLQDQDFIINIAKYLNIENFSLDNVDRCFRVRSNRDGRNACPVVVRFSKLSKKLEFFGHYLSAIKKGNLDIRILKKDFPASPLYINDHLDKITSGLFFKARQLRKDKVINKVLIKNGSVMIQIHPDDKLILVNSSEVLDGLN